MSNVCKKCSNPNRMGFVRRFHAAKPAKPAVTFLGIFTIVAAEPAEDEYIRVSCYVCGYGWKEATVTNG